MRRAAAWRPAPSYDINTVAALIDAMGGSKAVALEFDLDQGETRRWEVSGHIPPGWHLRLFAKTLLLQRSVAPAVFGFSADGEDWQALASAAALLREGLATSTAVSSPLSVTRSAPSPKRCGRLPSEAQQLAGLPEGGAND